MNQLRIKEKDLEERAERLEEMSSKLDAKEAQLMHMMFCAEIETNQKVSDLRKREMEIRSQERRYTRSLSRAVVRSRMRSRNNSNNNNNNKNNNNNNNDNNSDKPNKNNNMDCIMIAYVPSQEAP
jgi:hypothetical protein